MRAEDFINIFKHNLTHILNQKDASARQASQAASR